MVTEPLVDPLRPPTEQQKRMLEELGRQYHMHGQQRYESGTQRYADPVAPSSTVKRGGFVWKVVQDLYPVPIDCDGAHTIAFKSDGSLYGPGPGTISANSVTRPQPPNTFSLRSAQRITGPPSHRLASRHRTSC